LIIGRQFGIILAASEVWGVVSEIGLRFSYQKLEEFFLHHIDFSTFCQIGLRFKVGKAGGVLFHHFFLTERSFLKSLSAQALGG